MKTHASLFSGIGGAELAAEWMGWENVFHCEINPFGRKVLEYWYPNSISYEDITKTDFSEWRGKVNVLTGGFPCQPFSVAGKRRGSDDDRYLWPEMLRVIREVQPSWIVGENVAGILTMVQPGEEVEVGSDYTLFGENDRKRILLRQEYVIETICRDLEREGYEVQPFVIPACAVGAPHRRDRVWIVARRIASDTYGNGRPEKTQQKRGKTEENDDQPKSVLDTRSSSHRADAGIAGSGIQRTSSDTSCYGDSGGSLSVCEKNRRQNDELRPEPFEHGGFQTMDASYSDSKLPQGRDDERPERWDITGITIESLCGKTDWRNFPTQSPVCTRDDGFPGRLAGISFPRWIQESVKALGNAWVPQVAYEIFKSIEEYETDKTCKEA